MIRQTCYLGVRCPHDKPEKRFVLVMIPVLIRQGQLRPWNHQPPKVLQALAFYKAHLAGYCMQDASVDNDSFRVGHNPNPDALLIVEADEIDLGSW